MSNKLKPLLCCLLLLLQPAVTTPPAEAMGNRPEASRFTHAADKLDISATEGLLVKAIGEIRADRMDAAMGILDSVLAVNPHFKLAHLIRGDLLLARAEPLLAFGDAPRAPRDKIDDFRQEALVRLQRYREQPAPALIPKYLLQMLPEQRYAVVVDAEHSRLYLYRNQDGVPHYVKDFYVTLGKRGVGKAKEGDKLSPEGVYFVTSSLSKEKLTDFYGPIAFPISYPNEWDRRLGRDGHGIWLHGTPSDTYSRPPRASDGCVVLTNPDITTLSQAIQAGLTPVVISDQVEWVDETTWKRDRTDLHLSFDNWLKDWSSRNTDRYLSHYSGSFEADGQTIKGWGEQKRQVNAAKQWIEVKATRVSMFGYPGKDEMAVITFDQNYRSNNLNNQMRKRQYWKRENGEWKIVYEGAA